MKRSAAVAGVVSVLAAIPSLSLAATVNITGTQSTGAYSATIDTSVLFDPNGGTVTASGTMDLSGLGSGGVFFAGLISKVDYDLHVSIPDSHSSFPDYRFFLDTAYASFQDTPRAGLGQYLSGGEITQALLSGLTSPITSFSATFGATSMSLTVQGHTTTLGYNFSPDNLTFTHDGSPYTDFSQGAYAFVGTYDGDSAFNVTFDGPGSTLAAVPLPAALPLMIGCLGGMGLLGWRRKRRNSTPPVSA
jgi:hypothetical protein